MRRQPRRWSSYVRIVFGTLLTIAGCVFVLALLDGVLSGDQDVIDATPGFAIFVAVTLIPGVYLLARSLPRRDRAHGPSPEDAVAGVDRLERPQAAHRTENERQESRNPFASDAVTGMGWLEWRRAKRRIKKERQESQKEQARVDGLRKFETRHAELIVALREAGHSPTVTADWADPVPFGDVVTAGNWVFILFCERCRHRHWTFVPRRFRRLSPDRPCMPR